MQRSVPWFWIVAIGLLLLAPGVTFRLLVDVLEGAALLAVVVPLLLAGAGLIAWQWARRRLSVCPTCGATSIATLECPACGTSFVETTQPPAPASWFARAPEARAGDAVIDITVSEVRDES